MSNEFGCYSPIALSYNEAESAVANNRTLSNEAAIQIVPSATGETFDTLTGLHGRRAFADRLDHLFKHDLKIKSSHVVCCLNLDRFRLVNQLYPVRAGDTLLKYLAVFIKERLGGDEFIAHVGGDQFAILFPYTPLRFAGAWAERTLEHLNGIEFKWGHHCFPLTASIGLSLVASDLSDAQHALIASEAACRAAKERGGNCVQIFDSACARFEEQSQDADWYYRVRKAICSNSLHLFEQPIVATSHENGPTTQAEILLSLSDETGKLIAANGFLPSAQRLGLATCIDRYVVKRIVDYLSNEDSHGMRSTTTFAVNLSGASLSNSTFHRFVKDELSKLTTPERLSFEVTETEVISNLSEASAFMGQMRDLGCHFALDDFGSGLCSFRYLKQLPVDCLKIDGQFVRACSNDRTDYAIVESIHRLSRVLSLKTVAEYVECEDAYKAVRQIGVDYCQGHYFGLPRLLY